MHRFIIILLVCLSTVFPAIVAQESNPFLEMIGKAYGECFERYEAISDSLFFGESSCRSRLVKLLAEAAQADPSGEWELNRRMAECHVRFYDSRDGGFIPKEEYTTEHYAQDLLAVAREAQNKGFLYVRLRALFKVGDAYRIFLQEYERAFACYLEVASVLDTLSQREFPWKLYMYKEIADFYISFREYTDAERFYRKITEDPDVTYKNNHRLYPALSGLALCYTNMGQYQRSDSCYLRILELCAPIEGDRYVWEGIAGGNIGYNYYLRGDMGKALSWMEPALKKMKRPNDDPYTSNLAANIANIYLSENDLANGSKYLAIALDYHRRTRYPAKRSTLLEVITRFHILKDDHPKASLYLDSTLRAKEKEQEAYSGLVLRRVEQQLRDADRRMHERELDAEKLRSTFYKRTVFWVSAALVAILLLSLLLAIYYRRTRQAYHELVLRSQQWAKVERATGTTVDEAAVNIEKQTHGLEENNPTSVPIPDSADRTIMEKIEQLMIEKKLFINSDLSLDMLAAELGLDRRHVSSAINACTRKNFYAYLNEYRVKEAIRIMSDVKNQNPTIDAVAFDSGFNDRRTFHRIFKQFTGLTPGAFRDSL